ncbi:MAG: polysaccharide biosynthesis C-terminal domain-containing protein, partial [Clostridia bacterium]|nr:polysaccharide biosynthesis C-terminal domain-containing protein [Clostridia bacterium]
FSTLLIPEIAGLFATGDIKKIKRAADKSLSVSLIFSAGVSAVFINYARDLGMSLYNQPDAVKGIIIMAPLIPVMYLDSTVDALLKGLGAQLDSMKINIIDASASLVLVCVLVPVFGIYGYMITVYFCEILNFILSFTRLVRVSGFKPSILMSLIRSVISAALTSGLTLVLKANPTVSSFPTPIRIVMFVIVYLLTVSLLSMGNHFRLRNAVFRDRIR